VKNIFKKGLLVLLLLFVGGIIFVSYFNRIPERTIPQGNTIVSPANGKVINIKSVDNAEITFFKNDIKNILPVHDINPPYTVVIIEMNLKNVHVQRAPIDGMIAYQEYFPGTHKNALFSPNLNQLVNTNEKKLIVFKNDNVSVGVVQVAGLAARRIRSFVKENDIIKKGDVYGKIILGSQIVVIIPKEAIISTSVGKILIDGESIIAEY